MIPQTDPKANYLAHREAIDQAMRDVLLGGWYILGSKVNAFEEAFARYTGCNYAVGVASGTDAIELALRAIGVGPGHVVFTVSHTAVATVVGVERSGAMPVLVDIDPATYTMDPQSLRRAIEAVKASPPDGATAKAIVVVHLYGHPADMGAICEIARQHDLAVVEDCAQGHGASWEKRPVGSIGQVGAFSFYPTKNLGAIGDGGAITTNDAEIAERCRMLREYGWRQRYVSEIRGVNSRLDELQAAILLAKLQFLNADNARRRLVAEYYDQQITNPRIARPTGAAGCGHVYHQYVVRCEQRDDLRQYLRDRGVGTLIHYPQPVHAQPAYRGRLAAVVPLPETERAAGQVLSLPIYPELEPDSAVAVAGAVNGWHENSET